MCQTISSSEHEMSKSDKCPERVRESVWRFGFVLIFRGRRISSTTPQSVRERIVNAGTPGAGDAIGPGVRERRVSGVFCQEGLRVFERVFANGLRPGNGSWEEAKVWFGCFFVGVLVTLEWRNHTAWSVVIPRVRHGVQILFPPPKKNVSRFGLDVSLLAC